MAKTEFYYPSSDGINNIHAMKWTPEGAPKAVVQIVHGMTEFVGRYSEFASFLAEHGYLVVGEDHLGHGGTVANDDDWGYFGKDGNAHVIKDIHKLRVMTQVENPDIPYFMMGHSMGSFLTRQYITELNGAYVKDLAGAIIMGTGYQPPAMLLAAKTLAKTVCMTKGERAHSKVIEIAAFGKYLSRIEDCRTANDWLTRDRKIIDWYRNEDWTSFHFTANGFYNMFKGIGKAHDTRRMKCLPEGFPMLLISGAEDPVGDWGEGVRKVWELYDKHTACTLDLKLYDDDRHEILNELNKEEVYEDLLTWLEEVMNA